MRGAVAGYVRLTVERKRGASGSSSAHEGLGQEERHFSRDIPRLRSGAYRVSGYFEGTGTSKPSRSSAKPSTPDGVEPPEAVALVLEQVDVEAGEHGA